MIHAFRLLARLKIPARHARSIRFGHTAERKTERKLIDDYLAMIDQHIATLKGEQIPLLPDWPGCPKPSAAMAISRSRASINSSLKKPGWRPIWKTSASRRRRNKFPPARAR